MAQAALANSDSANGALHETHHQLIRTLDGILHLVLVEVEV
jgi:hypothetical protein